jgi:hypothetical protein
MKTKELTVSDHYFRDDDKKNFIKLKFWNTFYKNKLVLHDKFCVRNFFSSSKRRW